MTLIIACSAAFLAGLILGNSLSHAGKPGEPDLDFVRSIAQSLYDEHGRAAQRIILAEMTAPTGQRFDRATYRAIVVALDQIILISEPLN